MSITSFQRKAVNTKSKIRGAKTDGPEIVISTGCSSLDACIGGGLTAGSILMIEEDGKGFHSQLLAKYFVAEGLFHKHKVLLYSSDVPQQMFLRNIPSGVEKERVTVSHNQTSSEPLKIAWRYQQLPTSQSTLELHGHSFDWSQPISNEQMSAITNYSGVTTYAGILNHMTTQISTHDEQVLRLTVLGLGSPLWEDEDDVLKFVYSVRALCRSARVVCIITAPTYWMQHDLGRARQIRRLCDVAVQLKNFPQNEKNKQAHLKDYSGLIKFQRIQRPNSLFTKRTGNTSDMAFSVKRKTLNIQKLHLPPALDEAPQIKATPGGMCSSRPGTSLLDF